MKEFLKTLECREQNCNNCKECENKSKCDVILTDKVNCMIYNNNRLNAVVVFNESGVHHHNF